MCGKTDDAYEIKFDGPKGTFDLKMKTQHVSSKR